MKQQSSAKSMIILGAVIFVAAIGYFYFQGSTPSDDALLGSTMPAPVVSADVINLLNEIQSLHIDTALFGDPAYQTLRDYTVAIPVLNVGRTNPFAPVPGMPGEGR